LSDPIECRGDPRDIGFDQGTACRADLQTRYARSAGVVGRLGYRIGRRDAHTARVVRDVARHFPHQAESLEGLSRGARVPRAWIDREIARTLATPSPAGTATALVACDSLCDAPALVVRSAPREALYRRVASAGGFESLELTLPWFPGALAGVNEKGLAVACAPGSFEAGECAAPATFLVRDCLRQFGSLDAAVEWCTGRPAAGRAALLLADARGDAACVDVAGDERRVRRPTEGLLWSAVPRGNEVAKSLREEAPVTPRRLAHALAGAEWRTRGPDVVLLDPARTRFGWLNTSAEGDAADVRWTELAIFREPAPGP
jgi:hypothetical protein